MPSDSPPSGRPATPPPATPPSGDIGRLWRSGGTPSEPVSESVPAPGNDASAPGPVAASSRPVSSSGASASSPASRSMSLYHLGIIMSSPMSPLRRQFSLRAAGQADDADDAEDAGSSSAGDKENNDSSSSGSSTGGSGNSDNGQYNPHSTAEPNGLAEDSRDVLVDRLRDLVRHLTAEAPSSSSSPSLASLVSLSSPSRSSTRTPRRDAAVPAYLADDQVLSALHSHVDEMESVLAAAEPAEQVAVSRRSSRQQRQHHHHHQLRQQQRARGPQQPLLLSPVATMAATSTGLDMTTHNGTKPALQAAAPIVAGAKRVRLGDAQLLDKDVRPDQQTLHNPSPPNTQQQQWRQRQQQQRQRQRQRQLAVACDELADDLSTTLARLAERSDELEHLQNLMLSQVAAATERAAALEQRVQELTAAGRVDAVATPTPSTMSAMCDRVEELESEVTFLRLQLRGIEVRSRGYVPANADPELAQSIENWKADRAALQARLADERTRTQG